MGGLIAGSPFIYARREVGKNEVVGEDEGLECKTASAYNADKWADENIPLHYIMQCCHYMAVTGKRTWYIAAVILGREFTYRKLE